MEIKNCVITKNGLFSKQCLYFDVFDNKTGAYLADNIFTGNNLKIKFISDFECPDSKYDIVLCKFKKKDEDKFADCMDKLERKMLLFGYTDYIEHCQNIINQLKNITSDRKITK